CCFYSDTISVYGQRRRVNSSFKRDDLAGSQLSVSVSLRLLPKCDYLRRAGQNDFGKSYLRHCSGKIIVRIERTRKHEETNFNRRTASQFRLSIAPKCYSS